MSPAEQTARPLSQTANRGPLARFARKYTLQIGIVGVAVVIWLLFLAGSPQTFLSRNIYAAFMSSTP